MSKKQEQNVGLAVLGLLAGMGLPPLPRNYELFYEFVVGSNEDLKRDVGALKGQPKQSVIDFLVQKHLPHHSGSSVVDEAHTKMTRQLNSISRLMEQEGKEMNQFVEAIALASKRISSGNLDQTSLSNIIRVMNQVTNGKLNGSVNASKEIAEKTQELKQVKQELDEYRRLANTDPLTQLANRRAFDERLAKIYESKDAASHSLLLLDIDKFKDFNDKFGHPVGDRVLKVVGRTVAANVRDALVARTGGEEFAVILKGADENQTIGVAERIRAAVEATKLASAGKIDYGKLTVSIGMCMGMSARNGNELYQLADQALYASKQNGRNRVSYHKNGVPRPVVGSPEQDPDRYAMYRERNQAEKERLERERREALAAAAQQENGVRP